MMSKKTFQEQFLAIQEKATSELCSEVAKTTKEVLALHAAGDTSESSTQILLASLVEATCHHMEEIFHEMAKSKSNAAKSVTSVPEAIPEAIALQDEIPNMPEGAIEGSYVYNIYKSIHESNKKAKKALDAFFAENTTPV
jgi:hypothetical protein